MSSGAFEQTRALVLFGFRWSLMREFRLTGLDGWAILADTLHNLQTLTRLLGKRFAQTADGYSRPGCARLSADGTFDPNMG
jgi:hypothetical protein